MVHVIDAWVGGRGLLQVSLFGGVVPLVQVEEKHQEKLLRGEQLRWLAEAALVPHYWQSQLVTWKEIDATTAQVALAEHPNLQLTVQLHNETLRIEGWRDCLLGDQFETRLWRGYLSQPKATELGVLPTHMVGSWVVDGAEQVYFEAENYGFQVEWEAGTATA